MAARSGWTLQVPQVPSRFSKPSFHLNRETDRMILFKTFGLFVLTAFAEIVGCYLAYLWLKQQRSAWLLVLAACSLAVFAWLLSLHPTAAGRVYAAYGGVYITVAILWLWLVDSVRPTAWDIVGVAVCLLGMGIIIWGARPA
jgi:small multidrug resistance family-3 protein